MILFNWITLAIALISILVLIPSYITMYKENERTRENNRELRAKNGGLERKLIEMKGEN